MQGVAVFGCQCIAVCLPDEECEYCPDRALSAALKDWMEELNQPLQAGKICINTDELLQFMFSAVLLLKHTTCACFFSTIIVGRQNTRTDQRASVPTSHGKTPDRSDCPSTFRGTSTVAKLPVFPLNSSSPPSSPTKVSGEREGREWEKRKSYQSYQPIQPPPGTKPGAPAAGGRGQKAQVRGLCGGKGLLSESQVRLLVGLHYLPHEHGPSAQKLLQDLTWLKTNCQLVSANSKKAAPQKVGEDYEGSFC